MSLLPNTALMTAFFRDNPLMRWAAQSALISVQGIPQTLFCIGFKESFVQAFAEAIRNPLLEVFFDRIWF